MAENEKVQITSNLRIPAVTHEQLKQLIIHKYKTKIPLFIWGTFGIGKSYTVKEAGKEIAKELGLEYSEDPKDINDPNKFVVIVIPMHQFDVSEIKGIGVPNRETKTTEFFRTNLLPKQGQGIIFFDEINLAPPLVQSNAYQLILDRKLGDYTVPEGYYVIGAGNTIEDMAHIHDMAKPLLNRFTHVQLKVPTSDNWIKNFALKKNIDHRIINFLAFKDDLLYKFDPEKDIDSIAIPTPRTWEFASRDIEGVEDLKLIEILIGSAVSEPVAKEFVAWLKLSRSYDIAKIFREGKIDPVPTEPSEVYALINAIISYYKKNPSDENAVKVAQISMQLSPEHQFALLVQIYAFEDRFLSRIAKANKETHRKVKEILKKFIF